MRAIEQVLAQHEKDVDAQHDLQETLDRALKLVEEEQLEKEQIISDKSQLDAKINWMTDRMQAEERAYRIIKKSIQPWVLQMRVKKLLREGKGEAFKKDLKQRDAKIVDMVYLLADYGKQLQVLFEMYCVPLEGFFEEKAYSLMDPNGFNLEIFQEYKHSVKQMAVLYKQVENEAS